MTPQEFKQHRIDLGLTQLQLADKLKIHEKSISRMENCHIKPRDSVIELYKKIIEENKKT